MKKEQQSEQYNDWAMGWKIRVSSSGRVKMSSPVLVSIQPPIQWLMWALSLSGNFCAD
jgi:hypothetical protein